MARITVEDCIDKFPSRFELVLVASQRARKLHSGDAPTVEKDNDKNTVIALREIADSTISVEDMKENLIQEYQTVTISDEEEENLELESSENIDKGETISESDTNKEVEEEINKLIKSEDAEIEEQYEITEATQDAPDEIIEATQDASDEKIEATQDASDEIIEATQDAPEEIIETTQDAPVKSNEEYQKDTDI